MPLLKPYEAVAIAAVLQAMRSEGSLQIRRPSWEQPTFWSRPVTVTAMPLLPPGPNYVDVLRWKAPGQYISVVTGYVATTVNNPVTANVDFQLTLDGHPIQGVNLAAAANLFKNTVYPVTPRPISVSFNQTQVLAIRARNSSLIPQTLLLSFTGWSYDTVNLERGSDGSGSQGITDD